MLTKKWYQSKTFWLNIIATILSIIGFLTPDLLALLGLTSTKFMAILGTVTAVLNMILRKFGQPTVISTDPVGTFVAEKK